MDISFLLSDHVAESSNVPDSSDSRAGNFNNYKGYENRWVSDDLYLAITLLLV